jgi:hypothetical protein
VLLLGVAWQHARSGYGVAPRSLVVPPTKTNETHINCRPRRKVVTCMQPGCAAQLDFKSSQSNPEQPAGNG